MVWDTSQQDLALPGAFEIDIHRMFPHFDDAQIADLIRIIGLLRETFHPERIYVFGSQARGTPNLHSDLDLLIVVPDAGEYPHHLAQEAFRVIGNHVLPLDIVFMGREDFEWRSRVVSSLPSTVLREGRLVYAAAAS